MNPADKTTESPAGGTTALSDARRRVLRGGLAAGPILMTVVSRPVLGQVACTPSAALSITMQTSLNHRCEVTSGLSPEQWKAMATQWPAPYCGEGTGQRTVSYTGITYGEPTAFHCPTTGLGGRVFGNRSMLDVIDMTQGGRNLDSMGRYTVAALLNARSGRTPMLSESGVRAMWNDLTHRGYYEPTAGIRWTAPDCVAYIKTTIA